jgi:multisubunit Na+/H+ antiporter MnhB subunit
MSLITAPIGDIVALVLVGFGFGLFVIAMNRESRKLGRYDAPRAPRNRWD